jgi:hypothetical protein
MLKVKFKLPMLTHTIIIANIDLPILIFNLILFTVAYLEEQVMLDGTSNNGSIVSSPMMCVDNTFNILTPDDDHIWSKHVVSMLGE